MLMEIYTCESGKGDMCSWCSTNPWRSPPISIIPFVMPDTEKLPSYHYKQVESTPVDTEDQTPRSVDDFSPRSQLRKAFEAGHLGTDMPDVINEFSKTYIVEEEYVVSYIQHYKPLDMVYNCS